MKKKQEFELTVEKLAFGGKGIARVNNQVVFVDGGIPGDRAVVRITRIKKNYAESKIVQLLEPSSLRCEAACQHFGYCGGCKWQNLEYQQQLIFKQQQVLESLEHIAGINEAIVLTTIPSPLEFGYRNKMEFSFTDRCWLSPEELANPEIQKGFAIGLHVSGSFDQVLPIKKCWLQDEIMNELLNFAQNYFQESNLPVFNLKTHEGLLRFLVLRKSFAYQNYMVNIVTFRPLTEQLKDFAKKIIENFPQVKTIINTVNSRFAQIAVGEEEYVLHGDGILKEKLDEFEFEISVNSFFQTNPRQAVNLYRKVKEFVGEKHNVIWDLYSGTGTIALFLSQCASKIIGFELVESAVTDAYRNCQKNNVDNCEFIAGDIRKNFKKIPEKPDVIVCDPPRSGMHPDVVKSIANVRPKKIVYVSCNPTTMARDIQLLSPEYFVQEVQPFDMFPHTYHIESVAKLELK